jgi:ATP-dependent RNA helicase SUPV3L1/SUV3
MAFATLLPEEARKRDSQLRGRGVTAVLGPTNTGKTHLALERMLGHESGMIGLPLRLLAREVYQRLVEKAGVHAVALVTGEEKIKPERPRYWVSTVEAMPRDIDVSFVAIDEVQLMADADRGHVFTDAVLHRRGRGETMLIGSGTARQLIESLLPGVTIQSRPRLSKLSYGGDKKITRLPTRSAIIAFSQEEVYAIAELVRRQRGGAAVVMGSLSPRTRNAQVAMFQAGEVDHIVATDAIGMGLNLDIGHVAFASDRKFDGHRHRRLHAGEFGQIAGRAGRAQNDGTFGSTGRCPPFEPEMIEALENHVFDPLPVAQWRNSALDFSSLARLEQSLAITPNAPELIRAHRAEDEVTFDIAITRPLVRDLATSGAAVRRLWDLCQLPDYRKVSPHIHADLVVNLYEAIQRRGTMATDWFAREVAHCDRTDGDIDTLSWRLAQMRTWSYCANRPDWLSDPVHWQNATRALEDRLSDALHERLMQRFVDRRTSVLMRRLKENVMLEAQVTATGDVMVEGQHVGRLQGFRFTADPNAEGEEARTLRAAASKALASEIETRATRLSTASDEQITLSLDGVIRYVGEPVAALTAGAKVLEPRLVMLADEQLSGIHREMAETRLAIWLKAHVTKLLGPLVTLEAAETLSGMARGIAFQAGEALGVLDRAKVGQDVKSLDQNARAELRKLGLRFGAHHLFLPALMKPGPRSLAAQLFALHKGGEVAGLNEVSHLAFSGRTSIPVDAAIDRELYRIAGYKVAGPRAIRVDILERLADLIRPAITYRPGETIGVPPDGTADGDGFVVTGGMTSLVGVAGADFGEVLKALGYRMESRPGPAITKAIKLPAPVVPVAVAQAAEAETVAVDTPRAEGEEAGLAVADASTASDTPTQDTPTQEAPTQNNPTKETPTQGSPAPIGVAAEAGEAAHGDVMDVETEASAATDDTPPAAQEADAPPAEPVAPVMIEVWRMGRPDRHHALRHERKPGERRHARPPQPGDAPTGDKPADQRGDRRDRPHWKDRKEGDKRPFPRPQPQAQPAPQAGTEDGAVAAPPAREHRQPRRDERGGDQPRHFGKGGKPQGKRENWRDNLPKPEKPRADKPVDPDSPFAKLLALKAKMEGKG